MQLALQPVPFGLGLQPLPFSLQFQPLGHVADRGHDQDALAGVDGGQGDLGRERAAVAAAARQFQAFAHRPRPRVGQIARPAGRVPGLDRVRDQDFHRLAGQLVPPVPEQPLGLRVHQHDPAARVHAHHRVRGRLEQPDQQVICELHGAFTFRYR